MMLTFMAYSSNPRRIEARLLAGPIAPQGALFADRVGTLENPVLPGGQPRKNLRFHRFRTDEAKIRPHAGKAVRGEARALLEEHADLVIPVDIVERKGNESKLLGFFSIERRADFFA